METGSCGQRRCQSQGVGVGVESGDLIVLRVSRATGHGIRCVAFVMFWFCIVSF